jgi:hypothetical protein
MKNIKNYHFLQFYGLPLKFLIQLKTIRKTAQSTRPESSEPSTASSAIAPSVITILATPPSVDPMESCTTRGASYEARRATSTSKYSKFRLTIAAWRLKVLAEEKSANSAALTPRTDLTMMKSSRIRFTAAATGTAKMAARRSSLKVSCLIIYASTTAMGTAKTSASS